MFVYKHTETIECIKKYTFQEKYKLYGWITQEFLRLLCKMFRVLFLYELKHIGGFSDLH